MYSLVLRCCFCCSICVSIRFTFYTWRFGFTNYYSPHFFNFDGPARIYCDNEAVYKNVAIPTSVLKKKMHSISYHFCREAVAAGIVEMAKEDSKTNLSDLFTKVMSKPRRDELIDRFMY